MGLYEYREYQFEIAFINDGSVDSTEKVIEQLSEKDTLVTSISFTRNFGKEAALCAGLDICSGDVVIPIDVDLQDPIDVIPQLIYHFELGADVVLAKRVNRNTDSWFKRTSASFFYSLHNFTTVQNKFLSTVFYGQ